ncbi:MAG: 2'-5' RNA ligase [Chloroflexi bacterium RBG_16_56_11]|nr:MAG: 2'-5' RNA ligase [Chloroflexi bacterium RBG_16_56_11]
MEQVRAFIAIELTAELKRALALIQSRLKTESRSPVKWVEPDSTHLTLKFLGSVDSEKIEEITSVMSTAARGIGPFELELNGLGVFPGPRQVHVIWVGLGGDLTRLGQLQQRIETGLIPLGFTPESRAFSPHLTLARVRDNTTPGERQQLGRTVEGAQLMSAGSLHVDSVHLIRSQLTRQGAIYSRLRTVKLD